MAPTAQVFREQKKIPDRSRGRDLLVVTIPQGKIPNLPPGLFKDAPDDLVVIDTGSYYLRCAHGVCMESTLCFCQ